MSIQESTQRPENIAIKKFVPRIMVFACGYCPLLGAREAGRQRLELPENFQVIAVECAARIEPDAVIRAFSLGIDGVAVLACHLDGCRYNNANHRSVKQMRLLATLLDTAGIDSRRLVAGYGTAHEAHQFAGLIKGFVNQLEQLPPLKSRLPAPARTDQTIEQNKSDQSGQAKPEPARQTGQPEQSEQSGLNMVEQAKKIVKNIIESGQSNGVLGLIRRQNHTEPFLFEDLADVDSLVLSPKWVLAKTALSILGHQPYEYRLSVICRGCDERAIKELIKRNQIDGNRVNIIGMACDTGQAESCLCRMPLPLSVDIGVPVKGVDPLEDPVARPYISCDIQVRKDLWQREFEKCIKCYGCRNACPLCNCSPCKLEDDLWVGQGRIPADPVSFHLIRAFHLADICVGCGACQDACPVGIPLALLQLPMALALDKDYGYCAGSDFRQRSPLFSNLTKDFYAGLELPAWTNSLGTDHEN